MSRRAHLITALAAAALSVLCGPAAADDGHLMDVLVAAYPDFLAGHEGNELIWKDGTRMPFDDGTPEKSFAARLDHPSIRDMYYAPYPLGPSGPPGVDIDPGRVRHQPLFTRMYGDCARTGTAKAMVDVVWLPKKYGRKIRVTSINGVAAQLEQVSAELDRLPARFDAFLFPPAGTFNCRVIAGTNRPSAHGTGTAIDIATRQTNYWLWEKPDASGRYAWRNRIPMEIVEIFERHGFIWGGRWYHYDTMHFEYRPDLIALAKSP